MSQTHSKAPSQPQAAKPAQYHIDEEIACLEREIKLRKSAYPGWVEKGRMKQEDADYEIAVMTSALGRLKSMRYLFSQIAPVF